MQKILLATSISILLSACSGGGGGESSSPTPTPTPTPTNVGGGSEAGQLQLGTVPWDIDGLGFKTATIDAITVDGKFSYNEGETITFMLGDNELFSVAGSPEQSLNSALLQSFQLPSDQKSLELALHKRPGLNSNANLSPIHKISNKIKLLLVLDNDKDSSNGIDLTDWHTKLAGTTIELNTRFDDNQAFYKTFQNHLKSELIHPTYLDSAMPLIFLYKAADIQIPTQQISSVEFINETSDKTITKYTYDDFGRVASSVEEGYGQLDEPSKRVSSNFLYNLQGIQDREVVVIDRNLETDTPTSSYRSSKVEKLGYLNKNYELDSDNKSFNKLEGPSINDLTKTFETFATFKKDKILEDTHIFINEGVARNDTYTFSYDEQGRLDEYVRTENNVTYAQTTTRSAGTDDEGNIRNAYSRQTENKDSGDILSKYEGSYTYNDSREIKTETYKYTNSSDEITTNSVTEYTYNAFGLPIIKSTSKYTPSTSDSDNDLLPYTFDRDEYSDSGVLTSQLRQGSSRTKVYTYKFTGADHINPHRYTQIKWTEANNTDLENQFRIQTYDFVYNENSGLLSEVNFNQVFEDVINNRRKVEYTYGDNNELKTYKNTYNYQDVGGAESVSTFTYTYNKIDDGVGYIVRNQLRETLNEHSTGESAEFDIPFSDVPNLINTPREE